MHENVIKYLLLIILIIKTNADVYFAHKHSVSVEMKFSNRNTHRAHSSVTVLYMDHTSCFN